MWPVFFPSSPGLWYPCWISYLGERTWKKMFEKLHVYINIILKIQTYWIFILRKSVNYKTFPATIVPLCTFNKVSGYEWIMNVLEIMWKGVDGIFNFYEHYYWFTVRSSWGLQLSFKSYLILLEKARCMVTPKQWSVSELTRKMSF